MKPASTLVLAVVAVIVVGCDGDRGPVGPQGQAGQDGTEITSEQILDKLKEVDGTGSGLDADTVDGTDLGAIEGRVAQLEAQVTNLAALADRVGQLETTVQDMATQLAALQTAQAQEVLYAFDGEGRMLGRVVSVELDSVVYFDRMSGIPVEVFLGNLDGDPEGIQDWKLCFQGADCEVQNPTNVAFLDAPRASEHLGLLDQTTGIVWKKDEQIDPEMRSADSHRNLADGTCSNVGVWNTLQQLEQARVIEPFALGVHVGAGE